MVAEKSRIDDRGATFRHPFVATMILLLYIALNGCVIGPSSWGCEAGDLDECYRIASGEDDPHLCAHIFDNDPELRDQRCNAAKKKAREKALLMGVAPFKKSCKKNPAKCQQKITKALEDCELQKRRQPEICRMADVIRQVPQMVAAEREEEERNERAKAEEAAVQKIQQLKIDKDRCYIDLKPLGCIAAASSETSSTEISKLLDFGVSLNSGLAAAAAYYRLSDGGKLKKFEKASHYISKIKNLLIPECESIGGEYCAALDQIANICDPSNLECKEIQLQNSSFLAKSKKQEEERLAKESEKEAKYQEARARQQELREMREERQRQQNIEAWNEVGNQLQKNMQQIYQQPAYQAPKVTNCTTTGFGTYASTTCYEH